jgi:hypothetical protein
MGTTTYSPGTHAALFRVTDPDGRIGVDLTLPKYYYVGPTSPNVSYQITFEENGVPQHTSPGANNHNYFGAYWYTQSIQMNIYGAAELDPDIDEITSVSFYLRPPTCGMDSVRYFAVFIYETPDLIIPATGNFPAPIVMATPPCVPSGTNCTAVNVNAAATEIAKYQAAGMHLVEARHIRPADLTCPTPGTGNIWIKFDCEDNPYEYQGGNLCVVLVDLSGNYCSGSIRPLLAT